MANLLGVTALTFALLFIITTATAASTITMITMEADNPTRGTQQQCRQQIDQAQQLRSCQRYLVQSSKTSMGPGGGRADQQRGGDWREEFQRCCQQLEQLDQQCRCEGVRAAVHQQRETGREELHGMEVREMLRTAEALPGLCRVGPQRCDNIIGVF